MSAASNKYRLPRQLETLLAVVARHLKKEGHADVLTVLANAKVEVNEGTDYDNWDGGQDGHAVLLHVPETLFHLVLSKRDDLGREICKLLNTVADVPHEYFSEVRVCLDHATVGTDWRAESGALLAPPTVTRADDSDVQRLWGTSACRVFLSHRAEFKKQTKELKDELNKFGFACFVAHEDIEPTRLWQTEIERALSSMHVLIALLSPGFRESCWTQQEVGIAIGRGVPVLAMRLGEDPTGFIGKYQAIAGSAGAPQQATALLNRLLQQRTAEAYVLEALVGRWEAAASFREALSIAPVFDSISELSDEHLERMVAAFGSNDQLHKSYAAGKFREFVARMRPGRIVP